MFEYVFPIIIVVSSNVLYHICQKSMSKGSNPFLLLLITYLTAAIISIIASQFYNTDGGIIQSFKELNWRSVVLGIAIVGLEFGYMLTYKAGWDISMGSLVANIALAITLIPIGIFFFKEEFSLNKVFGVIFCIIGLIFINKK